MRKYPVSLVVMLMLSLGLAACSDPDSKQSAAEAGLTLTTADGDALEWESLRGQWVLVNYWAEWCKPCLEEIPELNTFDQREDVTVLAVNFDGVEGEELRELGERMDIGFAMLAEDPAGAMGWEMPGALPVTFAIDPEGNLRETLLGPQTEEDLLALVSNDE